MPKSKKNDTQAPYIGFDMDGVIIDHTIPKIRLAEKFGFSITPEQTPSDILKNLMPEKIRKEFQHTLYSDLKIALESPLMRGAKPALREIVKSGIPFVLITRRKDPEVAMRLLERHGLWPEFFHEKNTFFVIEPEDKNAKASELGLTHYLDDELKVLNALIDVENKFLFDKYDSFPDMTLYPKISSWQEFLEKI